MKCVSLVCTVHDEMWLANVSELRAILERIQPEVIFLEVPPADFENLESNAVRQYRFSTPCVSLSGQQASNAHVVCATIFNACHWVVAG